jgi:hypothetical protein
MTVWLTKASPENQNEKGGTAATTANAAAVVGSTRKPLSGSKAPTASLRDLMKRQANAEDEREDHHRRGRHARKGADAESESESSSSESSDSNDASPPAHGKTGKDTRKEKSQKSHREPKDARASGREQAASGSRSGTARATPTRDLEE